MSERNTTADLSQLLLAQLESLRRAGVKHLPRVDCAEPLLSPPATAEEPAAKAPEPSQPPAAAVAAPSPAEPPAQEASASASELFGQIDLFDDEFTGPRRTPEEQAAALAALREEVAGCVKCAKLAESRTQTVFGVGNPAARLCFFGEAPGADEDRQGEPFVGRAGQLLTDIIEKGCRLKRSDVYILNVLKCRPPGNRNPLPLEIDHCRRFFEQQLEIIQPEMICCLGSVAAQTLLATDSSVGRMRGKIHRYRGAKVVVTYHPAYLLRNPSAKRQTWEDVKLLLREMGLDWTSEAAPRKPR